jgi:hypothetical protein
MEYTLHQLLEKHNRLVKDQYKCDKMDLFVMWLENHGNDDEGYIEIPSNQTISGHAEILEYDY